MYQAASFDSSMTEATGRLNTLAVNMTGGNIGEAVQSDYQARMTWLNLFKECAAFYKDHPPFEIVYEPDLTQGDIDFGKGTVALSFRTALVPSDSGFKVLNDLLGRLEQTGNRSKWGFAGWPLLDVQPREPAAVVFGGKREFSFAVEAAILNEDGKTIASGRITLNSRAIGFSSGDGSVIAPVGSTAVFRFPNVNANDLTENLTIGITKIDGMDAGTAGEKGYIRIAAEKARVDRIETTIRNEQARIAAEQARIAAEQARQAAERQRLAEAEERQRAEERRLQEEERELQRIFDFSNGVITKYNGYEKTVTIPSRIGNTPVTKIGTGAFLVFYNSWRTKLTSVTIPNGIISIEDQAFIHNQLTSVTIPASVTFIGVGAFYDNPLTSITIGANVHLINDMTYPSLPRRFVLDYESQGKKAGTYVYMNSKWVKQ
ncbi:hypothetical protein FACS189450_15080 [Spirochaetia bacterium]|nr:hypothetical protein FACS189450_15080 [Spirochaetia bacterium]